MATDPVELASAVKEFNAQTKRQSDSSLQPAEGSPGLVQNLISEFGLGTEPQLRRTLYERLARLEAQHGQKFEILLAEARMLARNPDVRRKGNYFARAITLKIREHGLL